MRQGEKKRERETDRQTDRQTKTEMGKGERGRGVNDETGKHGDQTNTSHRQSVSICV